MLHCHPQTPLALPTTNSQYSVFGLEKSTLDKKIILKWVTYECNNSMKMM